MSNGAEQNVIPENELRCQWMDVGVVEYKLCDKYFQCDQCMFDREIRFHQHSPKRQSVPIIAAVSSESGQPFKFDQIVKRRLDALSAYPLPDDRLYHRNHFWMEPKEKEIYRFGLDAVAANLWRPIMSVVISRAPSEVKRMDPYCWIVLSEGAISLHAPVDGMLMRFNPEMVQQPSLITSDPFGKGWLVEMSIKHHAKGIHDFCRAEEIQEAQRRGLASMKNNFEEAYTQNSASVGITMNDGGVVIQDIENVLGAKTYFEIVSRICFLP
ncbi:MAG: glycine cleavage system protein H [Bacteroidota bacterium]